MALYMLLPIDARAVRVVVLGLWQLPEGNTLSRGLAPSEEVWELHAASKDALLKV